MEHQTISPTTFYTVFSTLHRTTKKPGIKSPADSTASVASLPLICLLACLGLVSGCNNLDSDVTVEGSLYAGVVEEGTLVKGFRAVSRYTNDQGQPMGLRMVHEHSGFTLALIQIDTAPQAYMWANTLPASNLGLPHTQEHLLLGKGNKGRYVAGLESMSLVNSSAHTAHDHTAYHMHTTAGAEVFYKTVEAKLDAMLYPDYTDEEIRREVHHFGVVGEEGQLNLQEKGTVYIEMQSSYNKPQYRLWYARQALLYGAEHPMAFNHGGNPTDIRRLEPEHIRAFHAEHYQLGNMGMIAVLPKQMTPREALGRFDAMLKRLQPRASDQVYDAISPPAAGSTEAQTLVTDYPSSDANEPISLSYEWPPSLNLDNNNELLLTLFLSTFAGDVSTNLYKRLVDSQTRQTDLTVSSVWAWSDHQNGSPISIGLSGVPAGDIDDETVADIRAQIQDELTKIAGWAADSDHLAQFNQRMLTLVIARERHARAYLNGPPGFGDRGTGTNWHSFLENLEDNDGFDKSLAQAPELAYVRSELSRDSNIWADHLTAWGMRETPPFAFFSRPSPELQAKIELDGRDRITAEIQRLETRFDVEDGQRALAAYQEEYNRATAKLEALKQHALPPFIEDPPLQADEFLDYHEDVVPNTQIPVVRSIFSSMTGASVRLALDLRGVPDEDLMLLRALILLFDRVGVIENGEPVSSDEVLQRTRREISNASLSFTTNPDTGRAELMAVATGTTPEETQLALGWLELFLYHPDLRPDNLARIRDVLDHRLVHSRRHIKGSEEDWVSKPMSAYRWQRDPIHQRLSSLWTRQHDTMRLRWIFRADEQGTATAAIDALAGASKLPAEQLAVLLHAVRGEAEPTDVMAPYLSALNGLDEEALTLVAEATRDLEAELPFLPHGSLAADWAYLCKTIAADLGTAPQGALQRMAAIRDSLLRQGGARMVTVGAETALQRLQPAIAALLEPLSAGAASPAQRDTTPLVWSRLQQRGVDTSQRLFVGLVIPGMQGGVVQLNTDLVSYENTEPDQLIDLLTAQSFGGRGGHSLFMRTWGAGLAYGNGVSASAGSGRLRYYAERSPSVVETLTFVTDELRKAKPDPSLVDYAITQNFWSYAADSFESRGLAMANALVDGKGPDKVSDFRKALLQLRGKEALHNQINSRLEPVLGKVLPGYGPELSATEETVLFVIGTDKDLTEFETWLQKVEAPETVLQRIYPRDYWKVRG